MPSYRDLADFELLGIEIDELGVATVTIPTAGSSGRRPAAIHKEVADIWNVLGGLDDVRSILVTGADDEFYCSANVGGLKTIPGMDKEATFELAQRLSKEGTDIVYGIVELDKPVVAAMIWPILCGMATSKLYLMTSDPLDGAEAERIGVVSLAVPGDEVAATARRYAERLATGPTHAVRYTKRALNQWLRLGGITAHDYSGALELLNFFGPELRKAVEEAGGGE